MEIKFDKYSKEALRIMQTTNKNLYFCGKGGTGKTTVINFFKGKTNKKVVLLGTTGVSAEMIGGETVHKFFGIIPGSKRTKLTNEKKAFIRTVDTFIIEESSMLRADGFDKVEYLMRMIMENDLFFGGKQFIFVGDLYQLPPVPERKFLDQKKTITNPAWEIYQARYKGLFFFDGNSFNRENFEVVELQKVHRQGNDKENMMFKYMLNYLRDGNNSDSILDYFNKKLIDKKDIHPKAILVATTNAIAFKYNLEKLKELPGESTFSNGFLRGNFPKDNLPNDERISFKEKARVMFTINHKDGLYMNGTLGAIIEINGSLIKIEKDDGGIIETGRYVRKKTELNEETGEDITTGTYNQYPFKVAFGITIHKCQGKSFEHIVIDLGWGAWEGGQVYTAISRVRSFSGLQFLKRLKRSDIKTSKEVIDFLNN